MKRAGADIAGRLHDGLIELGLGLDTPAELQLIQYLDLLARWNRVHNLTAVREPEAMVSRHLLDCLAVVPYAVGASLLDIGAGAGLPGLVLAIAKPTLQCTLVDSRAKKVAFLNVAIAELGLANARAVHARVEELPEDARFDLASARAVGDLGELWHLARTRLLPGGRLLALRGHAEPEGIEQLRAREADVQTIRLQVPGLAAARHLVLVSESLSLAGPNCGKPAV